MSQFPLILRHYHSLFSIMPKEFPNGIDLNEIIQNLDSFLVDLAMHNDNQAANQPSTFRDRA